MTSIEPTPKQKRRHIREAELLATNNHYLQRARDADARARSARDALRGIAVLLDNVPTATLNAKGFKTLRELVTLHLVDQDGTAGDTFRALDDVITACHGAAVDAGWWTDIETGASLIGRRNVAEMLCLIHSEISEAMEGHRKGLMDDKLPHRKMIEVELADALIRIFDLAGALKLDLAGAAREKMAYNAKRVDHRLEHRRAAGGKAY